MDQWKYYAITHVDHVVLNPASGERLDEIARLLDLPPEPRVLDIACGTGELLLRLAGLQPGGKGAGLHAVGVDISPWFLGRFREAAARRTPEAGLEILEMDGADYAPAPRSFDLACCVGASWVFGGHRPTLEALRAAVRPGGQVLVGEPFWRTEPDDAYLAWSGLRREEFGSHASNVRTGEDAGLVPLLAFVSEGGDWDRYETLQWRAAARYAEAHPDDPDVLELLERVDRARHEYLAWGRDTMGWALYLFGRPSGQA
jgi:SAM-dependent methyltransferase